MVNLKKHLIDALLIFTAIFAAVLLNSSRGHSEEQELSDEELVKWLAEGTGKLNRLAERKSVPIRVLVVTGIDKKTGVNFMKIDAAEFSRLGMFVLGESADVAWSLLVNKVPQTKSKDDAANLSQTMHRVFGISGSDLIVYAPEKGGEPWSIRIDDGSQIRTIATVPRLRNGADIGKVYDWILESLGYNGIVLDQRNEFFLIAGRPDALVKEAQAVVLGDSAGKTSLKQKEKSGTALLKLVKSDGIFGIFKLTYQKSGKPDPKVGDKLSVSK
jgi:hypothetical protein